MSDPLIRAMDHYVVLEPGKDEKLLDAEETFNWLYKWLKSMNELPKDLQDKNSLNEVTTHLLDTACNLEIKQGFILQWFAVRIDSPNQ